MTQSNSTTTDDLTSLMNSVRSLADETRVKAHLAGMDAKTRWRELQAQLDTLEHRMNQQKDKATTEVRGTLEELRSHFREFSTTLSQKRSA